MGEDIGDGIYRDDEGDVWVTCPECGNEQADMGACMKCEGCGYAPMPYEQPGSDAQGRKR